MPDMSDSVAEAEAALDKARAKSWDIKTTDPISAERNASRTYITTLEAALATAEAERDRLRAKVHHPPHDACVASKARVKEQLTAVVAERDAALARVARLKKQVREFRRECDPGENIVLVTADEMSP